MTLRLYRASEVCEMTELQPYVLRSWEKEFPGIGVQRTSDGPKLYRQADVDQVLRIKQLVFGEGLTLAGARRRLEDAGPARVSDDEVAEVLSTLGASARVKVASVREGLKALEAMLAEKPDSVRREAQRSLALGAHEAEALDTRRGRSEPTGTADKAARSRKAEAVAAARRTPEPKRRRASA
jgi:DNA-binding transcriptional MerR regulator